MATATLTRPKAKRLWTYDDMLAELPESNLPTELWDGEIIRSPTPTPSHQTIVLNIVRLLNEHVREKKAGAVFVSPLDVVLSSHRVVHSRAELGEKAVSKLLPGFTLTWHQLME